MNSQATDKGDNSGSAHIYQPAMSSLVSAQEAVDLRMSLAERPAEAVLDECHVHQLHDDQDHKKTVADEEKQRTGSQDTSNEVIYVCYLASLEILSIQKQRLSLLFTGRI